MEDEQFLAAIERDAALIAGAVARADRDVPVPSLDWTLREVVIHTGAVHRWAGDIVTRALATNETGGSRAFEPVGVTDDELPGWLEDGAADLIATLRSAPAELACFAFLRQDSSRRFWIRRQAHETAIHRADVEAVAGGVTPFDADFAQDGLHELVGGFARGRAFSSQTNASLLLAASDGPSWLVEFGGERNVVTRDAATDSADAVVSGTSGELYLWAWNRPSTARADGDPSVLDLWSRIRI